ncbi:MAG: Gfo/Idh/MocA family oxidoreductase [Anaerocolumna aminovalerica]|jgi:predicted dehydrogenase|uniref:Gfo/Idh/MocA family protein n=1 Tax=Anaerocolumna aminovalerica TaxID=1527 RepID=UPI001C0EBD78|nr:Gfo/Idh/MocA family oxidoreductase [Anaerocolumna aminovalerica]MBU5332623.1 Gfo/Idh/MocA family oxidoreductase [Anaerocolumna aminovalerica]MDU6265682.1 Gfo/Idh/MocA family oxidoreductase [Anaerocolumna aminovalerica]
MNLAIIGCEHIHADSYIEEALNIRNINLIGLAEPDTVVGRPLADKYGIEYYDKYSDLIFSKEVDTVCICSSNIKHAELTIEAAKAGKHVIVEKPIATTIEDGKKMIEACKMNGVKLMVALPCRYIPSIVRAKEIIDNGEIGEIVAITGTNHGTMPGGWFVDKEKSGGGAIIDHTIHVADIMHWFLDKEVEEVFAKGGRYIHDIPVEDTGLIFMQFKDGPYATLDTSWNRPKSFPTWGDVTLNIIGTKGSINVDSFKQHGNLYSNKHTKSLQSYWGDDMNRLMLEDFADAIDNDRLSPISGEDGLFALKVAIKAYESIEKGIPVKG